MHGIIFAELKKFVVTQMGPEAWNGLLQQIGAPGKVHLPTQVYPDAELVALVKAASQATGKEAPALLQAFGQFIAPDLLQLYRAQVNPNWKTLELLEHTEETIHRVVRLRDPNAKPPQLVVRRDGPSSVVIRYTSPRKLCDVAKGITRGVAEHYKEKVHIVDERCMLKGDDACEIRVTLQR